MRRKKAQGTLEYAALIAVIAAGLIFMQAYLKRGYQGNLKSKADELGEQYSPDTYTSHTQITIQTTTHETTEEGVTTTDSTTQQTITKSENLGALSEEKWPE